MKFPNTVNVLLALALCGGLLLTMAFAQGRGPAGPPPPREGGRLALHFLDLTDAQKAQIKTIQDSEDAQAETLFDKLRAAHDALAAATAKGQFNEAQVRALAAAIAQQEIELTVTRARKDAAIYLVLTAEQRAKLDQFQAEHEAHRPPARSPRDQ